MSRVCEAAGLLTGPCREEAAGQFTGACVHEHVRTRWLCEHHADGKPPICRACWESPQSHECAILLAPAASEVIA